MSKRLDPTVSLPQHSPNHEDGEASRHLPTGDRAAPSRRIQQRRQGPWTCFRSMTSISAGGGSSVLLSAETEQAADERFRHQGTADPHDRLGDRAQLRSGAVLAAAGQADARGAMGERFRFVARSATGSRLLLGGPAGPEQESPIVADREATRLVVRESRPVDPRRARQVPKVRGGAPWRPPGGREPPRPRPCRNEPGSAVVPAGTGRCVLLDPRLHQRLQKLDRQLAIVAGA